MSQTGLKTGDLDLDLQGQIGLQTWRIFFKLLNLPIWNFAFTLR